MTTGVTFMHNHKRWKSCGTERATPEFTEKDSHRLRAVQKGKGESVREPTALQEGPCAASSSVSGGQLSQIEWNCGGYSFYILTAI